MPRYTSRYTWRPGRNNRNTREAHEHANQPGFFSRFTLPRNLNYNYNDILRRMTTLFEYGHPERTVNQAPSAESAKPDPADVDVLGVESVDFNIPENTRLHHTSEYDITDAEEVDKPHLVVRRGQPFDISIRFNRPYDKTKDELKLVFQAGKKPSPSKGTHVEMILSDKDEPKEWGAKIKNMNQNVLNVTVFTPPNCFVAKWKFKLDVLKKKEEEKIIFRYNHKDEIYVIFNPWCKDDSVYMENEKEKQEYVMTESGRIYSGSARQITSKPWNFGQFQGKVLECCMYLLDEANMNWAVRGNPIPIVRKITAVVNAPDDSGVLVGNWSGDYAGGTSPLAWTGSQAILEKYLDTQEPVCYGQCWVFSGVTTTVCRALGIPARSVTNFASAHDTDGSVTIDIHFDEMGEADDSLNDDSVWNFHVWNEAWMSRPDLPSGYGGWQAMDATPQETSDGVYCCGPVPVLAIKRGEVNLPYDGQFVFAEVNADKVFWTVDKDGSCRKVYIEKRGVGKSISTKALNVMDREDLTHQYKFAEGTDEERVAVLKANQTSTCREKNIYELGESDVSFALSHCEDKFVGQALNLLLSIKNNGKSVRSVSGRLAARSMYYTGVPGERLTFQEFDVRLQPGESKEVPLTVNCEHYQGKLKDMCMLQLSGLARVDETKQVFTNMMEARLRKPHLQIQVPKEGMVGKQLTAKVSFVNPLPETLTGCKLEVEGPGLAKPMSISHGNVPANGTFTTEVSFTPKKAGAREMIFNFNSKQIEDINGTYTVKIQPK